MRHIGLTVLLACTYFGSGNAHAQQAYRMFYPEPPADVVQITRNIPYASVDSTRLSLDLYRPAKMTGPAPVLILFGLFWPPDRPVRETNDWLISWARIAAANGIAAIVPDLRAEPGTGNASGPARARGDDFQRLLAHVQENAGRYGLDRERIALFAGSGAVAAALPLVEDARLSAIKAAVMYYGGAGANVSAFRLDLPLLYVRAGLDSPGMNAAIMTLVSRAAAQNAPVTLLNHHTGYHGFEGRNDDVVTRQIIEQTLEFIKRATAPAFQAALRSGHLEAVAAGHISAGNYGAAAQAYAELLKQRPGDMAIHVSFGSALLADQQYNAACSALRALTPPRYGALLPGTRACVLAGSNDAAIALLQNMPQDYVRFAAARLRADSVYAPLWPRADFQALMGR